MGQRIHLRRSWGRAGWLVLFFSVVMLSLPSCLCSMCLSEDDLLGDAQGEEVKAPKKKRAKKCKGFKSCEKACDEGVARACVKLGDLHRKKPRGEDGKWDREAVISAYEQACDADLALGCEKFAEMEYYNSSRAYKMARKGCKKGSDRMCVVLSEILVYGREYDDKEVKEDKKKSFKLVKKHCGEGSMLACSVLAERYQWGNGVDEDGDKARKLYRKACKAGVMHGCQYHASMFVLTRDKDFSKGVKALARVCTKGLAGGFDGAANACRVEGDHIVDYGNTRLLQAYVAAGRPSPGTSSADDFKASMEQDEEFQKILVQGKKHLERGCAMGSEDACKLLEEENAQLLFDWIQE